MMWKYPLHKFSNLPARLRDRFLLNYYIKPFTRRNKDRKLTPQNTILLFCQPRSGSTWLAEILSQIPQSCLIDEPLWRGPFGNLGKMPLKDLRKVKELIDLNFYHFQPILETEEWPEALILYEKIISGQIPMVSLYNEQGISRVRNAQTYVTKFNYAQLQMHWILKNLTSTGILLIRHPCAVVNSMLNYGSYFLPDQFDPVDFPDFRNSSVFQQYSGIFKSLNSHEEHLAFLWAVQIKHSLYHNMNNERWLTLSYEALLTNYQNEIKRLFDHLKFPIPSTVFNVKSQPSKSTRGNSQQYIEQGNQLGSWRSDLNKQQIKRILNVTKLVGVDVYDDTLEPDYERIYGPLSI